MHVLTHFPILGLQLGTLHLYFCWVALDYKFSAISCRHFNEFDDIIAFLAFGDIGLHGARIEELSSKTR